MTHVNFADGRCVSEMGGLARFSASYGHGHAAQREAHTRLSQLRRSPNLGERAGGRLVQRKYRRDSGRHQFTARVGPRLRRGVEGAAAKSSGIRRPGGPGEIFWLIASCEKTSE